MTSPRLSFIVRGFRDWNRGATMIARSSCCVVVVALLPLVGCAETNSDPVVVRFDSSDATEPATAGETVTQLSAPPGSTGTIRTTPENGPPKNGPRVQYQIASPSDPKSTSPAGTSPFQPDKSWVALDMSDSSLLGKPAPQVDLPELNGGRFQLANHRNVNIVVLDLCATWCASWVRGLPALTRVMRSYENKGVVFRAVSVDEDRAVVSAFLKSNHLEMPIALDEGGKLADAFDAQTLPVVVIIDKTGVVRATFAGEIDSRTALTQNLDALLENRPLPRHSMAVGMNKGESSFRVVHGVDPQSDIMKEGSALEGPNPIRVHSYGKPDWRLTLESGRVIDVGKIFDDERAQLEERLRTAYDEGRFLRLNHPVTNTVFLLFCRGQGLLNGPLASFYDNGFPTAYMDYKAGKRISATLTWDEKNRPLVFEQYKDGEKHGLRCLFKTCAADCPQGHLWMVEEWSRGSLQQSHLVSADGKPITFGYSAGKPIPRDDVSSEDLELAMAKLDAFDKEVAANELDLKGAIAQLVRQERRADREMRSAASTNRNRQFMASVSASMRRRNLYLKDSMAAYGSDRSRRRRGVP